MLDHTLFGPKHDPYMVGVITGVDSVVRFPRGMIFIGRSRIGGSLEGPSLPYVQPCTVTNEEIGDRTSNGEFSFDVIDDHSSTIWFTDRSSFRLAWSIGRQVVAGKTFGALWRSDMIYDLDLIDPGSRITIEPSAHHIGRE